MEYGFFHPSVGYWQVNAKPIQEVLASYPEGTVEVPLQPSTLHTFVGGIWVPPVQAELDALAALEVRADRNSILANIVDPLVSNPLRWAELTAAQQQAWIDYRIALLDVPQQAGFPQNVSWPSRPGEA